MQEYREATASVVARQPASVQAYLQEADQEVQRLASKISKIRQQPACLITLQAYKQARIRKHQIYKDIYQQEAYKARKAASDYCKATGKMPNYYISKDSTMITAVWQQINYITRLQDSVQALQARIDNYGCCQ